MEKCLPTAEYFYYRYRNMAHTCVSFINKNAILDYYSVTRWLSVISVRVKKIMALYICICFSLGARYRTQDSPTTQQDFKLAKIIIHPDYEDFEKGNDIALVKLAKRAVFTRAVRPVCLPVKRVSLPFNEYKNPKCWITGWGDLSYKGRNPEILKEAPIPLVSR